MSGIPANVRDPHVDFLTEKTLVQRELPSGLVIVDVTENRPKRCYLAKRVGNRKIAYIASVPDLIGLGAVF